MSGLKQSSRGQFEKMKKRALLLHDTLGSHLSFLPFLFTFLRIFGSCIIRHHHLSVVQWFKWKVYTYIQGYHHTFLNAFTIDCCFKVCSCNFKNYEGKSGLNFTIQEMDEVKTIKSQRVKTPVNHALAIVNRNNNSTLHYFHY